MFSVDIYNESSKRIAFDISLSSMNTSNPVGISIDVLTALDDDTEVIIRVQMIKAITINHKRTFICIRRRPSRRFGIQSDTSCDSLETPFASHSEISNGVFYFFFSSVFDRHKCKDSR